MKTKILFAILFFVAGTYFCYGQTDLKIDPKTLAVPEENGIWVQPAQNTKAQPIWGICRWHPDRDCSARRSTWTDTYLYSLFRA